jgi:hypothetical protein
VNQGRLVEIRFAGESWVKPVEIAAPNIAGYLSDNSFIPVSQGEAIEIDSIKEKRR